MDLHEYFTQPNSLSVSQLAERIGVKNVAQIRQWQYGYANRIPSPENCLAIETATNKAVTRQELRPNDFWKIWPDLAHLRPQFPKDQACIKSLSRANSDEMLFEAIQPVFTSDRHKQDLEAAGVHAMQLVNRPPAQQIHAQAAPETVAALAGGANV